MDVYFIEFGMGMDLHGQNVTKAAVRAVRDAIGHNSLPGMRRLLPEGDLSHMRVRVTLAIPVSAEELDVAAVKDVLPYGQVELRTISGGMIASSGVVLPEKGDSNDHVYAVIAQVEVGM